MAQQRLGGVWMLLGRGGAMCCLLAAGFQGRPALAQAVPAPAAILDSETLVEIEVKGLQKLQPDTVLFKAGLKYEIRLDEADKPFLWVTTLRRCSPHSCRIRTCSSASLTWALNA